MPGKKGTGFTAQDYQAPLRRPGEKREDITQDGGKETPSASVSGESEKVNPSSEVHVVSDLHVGESVSSQVPEEKPVDEGNKQKEPEEKYVEPQKTETVNTDVSEAKEETDTKSSTAAESVDVKDTEPDEVKNEALKTPEPTNKIATLSPFATEFVPKVAYDLQSAVDAAEFVPRLFLQQNNRPPLLRQQSNEAYGLMNCVKDVLFGLTQSPGELDSYVNILVKMLKKQLSTLYSLREVVDLIFEYSITEPNFQYIAAKLCNLLSKEKSIVPKDGKKFRSVLMNRCRDEHLNRDASLQNPASATRLLGFAMFEAELFCNYRPLGESQPLKVFHRGLLEMLNTLIQNHSEDCLKCIGKMLKMTGFLLDDPKFMVDDKDRKEKVEKVFSDVEKLSKESVQSDSVKGLLSQVIKLRATNWGNGPGDGLPGTYTVLPSDDGYFVSGYASQALGMDELTLDDDLTPVTNPEQWSDYYDDGEDLTAPIHDTYKYYFPEQFNEEFSNEIDGEYDEYDPEFDYEIEEEFEKFLQEQESSFQ